MHLHPQNTSSHSIHPLYSTLDLTNYFQSHPSLILISSKPISEYHILPFQPLCNPLFPLFHLYQNFQVYSHDFLFLQCIFNLPTLYCSLLPLFLHATVELFLKLSPSLLLFPNQILHSALTLHGFAKSIVCSLALTNTNTQLRLTSTFVFFPLTHDFKFIHKPLQDSFIFFPTLSSTNKSAIKKCFLLFTFSLSPNLPLWRLSFLSNSHSF